MRLIYNTQFLIYDREDRAVGIVHSAYADEQGRLALALLEHGADLYLEVLRHCDDYYVRDNKGNRPTVRQWLEVLSPAGLHESIYEEGYKTMCPSEEDLAAAFLHGRTLMTGAAVREFVKEYLEASNFSLTTSLDLCLDSLDAEPTCQECFYGHHFSIDARVSEQCIVQGMDYITCGVDGCAESVPVAVLKHLAHTFNPCTQTLIKSLP